MLVLKEMKRPCALRRGLASAASGAPDAVRDDAEILTETRANVKNK